jgi:hypothetical protein
MIISFAQLIQAQRYQISPLLIMERREIDEYFQCVIKIASHSSELEIQGCPWKKKNRRN